MLPADGTIAARVAHWEFGISRRQLKLDYTRGAPAKRRLLPACSRKRQSFMQFGKFLVLMLNTDTDLRRRNRPFAQ
jgi:hypothetical protein